MPWNVDVTFATTATRRTRRRHADELRRRNPEEQCVAERAIAITTERMREYSAARLDAGAAPATVNKELAALRRMLRLGIGRKHREDVPMLHVENTRTGFAIPSRHANGCSRTENGALCPNWAYTAGRGPTRKRIP